MNENAAPKNEKARLRALKEYGLLQLTPQPALDQFTELATLSCHFPYAVIAIAGDEKQLIISSTTIPGIQETTTDWGFMQLIMEEQAFTAVEDTLPDPVLRNNKAVTDAPHIRAFAGYPLIDIHGFVLGALYMMSSEPGTISGAEQRALKIITQNAVEAIRAERQKEETRYYAKLFNLSEGLVCVGSYSGRLRRINKAFTSLLGWEEHELTSISVFDLVHPDDVENTGLELEKLRSGLSTINFSHRFRTKDGDYKYIQWIATPELHTGNIFAIGRDITHEKIKEQELIDSENNARTFFENSLGMMCKHDLQGNLTAVNKASADSVGYSIQELLTMSLYQIVPPEYHSDLDQYLAKIRMKGKVTGLMHTRHKLGNIRIWLFNNVLVTDVQGNTCVIGNAVDITERHELEIDLKRTKEMLERTNQVARIGGWEFDLIKHEVFWSTVTCEIHEVGPEFKPTTENTMIFYEGEYRQQLDAVIDHAVRTGTPWQLELQITTAKGHKLWVRSIGHAAFENGVCKRLFGTFQDINERKKASVAIQQSRKLLEDVLQSASEVSIIATDHEGIITLFNKGAEKLLGYSAAELTGKYSWELLHSPDEVAARGKELSELYRTPIEGFRIFTQIPELEGSEGREWTYVRKDGTTTIVSMVVTPIRDNTVITGYLGIATDISKRKKAERELKEAKLQAEHASKAKSEFLANMSHEIRTPLNGVIGFTDLLMKTALNETQQQYVSIVNQSGNSLLSIINDILDFSKIEAGKIELDISKCDLLEFSSQASDILSFQAQQKGIEMLLNVSTDLPRFMWADVVRLKQILLNLLSNAVKFTDQGEIELEIRPLGHPRPGMTTIRFQVRDTGIGIHKSKQQKIFEAFLQEDISTTKRYGGTGLGLSISNKLLALMGSQLQLESSPGKGSTFFFEITVKTEDGAPIAWENIDLVKNVLIVDDNEHNRTILKRMLQMKGIDSDEASNGIEAFQFLMTKQQYDVIMMDYHMPFMDGLETIRKIRTNFEELKKEPAIVLLHSSADDEKILRACEELHVNQRLLKPIKIQEMYHALSHLFIKDTTETMQTENREHKKIKANINILIAEDNPINMLLASTIIRKIAPAAHITEAKNGKEAVESCKQQLPDIIFMDIQMPIINGYEATRLIREISPHIHIPIIALTAGNVKGEREKCIAAGMDDFVTKPFVENNLISVFEKWLTWKSVNA
ncbi:PAS domain S-box protein [Chitinophaga sp. CF418]|uniref:PAS domain S-box protein n=1 Tax=Chitinophaga sp. CF418 TaxID=1855287 RepID=UPI00091A5C5C|nr:PAS domain S-box protein [Chitinophaga sp. CF418]SHN07264.1 PAS domain S-box-containing protein [Chitinophaga sp. CF418]